MLNEKGHNHAVYIIISYDGHCWSDDHCWKRPAVPLSLQSVQLKTLPCIWASNKSVYGRVI